MKEDISDEFIGYIEELQKIRKGKTPTFVDGFRLGVKWLESKLKTE